MWLLASVNVGSSLPCWQAKHAKNIERKIRGNVNFKVLMGWMQEQGGWGLCGIAVWQWKEPWRQGEG